MIIDEALASLAIMNGVKSLALGGFLVAGIALGAALLFRHKQ